MPADWQAVNSIPKLTGDEVQVWRLSLDEESASDKDDLKLLSQEETERASRLRVGQIRQQFLVGRNWVRRLLGHAMGISPTAVPITVGAYGKPELPADDESRIHFNVAHSRNTVLVALSRLGPVGIDLEYLDRATDVMEVARHSLTDEEISILSAIDDAQSRVHAFFRCWTRKEAVVKADGRGLSLPLTSFEVPLVPACQEFPVAVVNVDGSHSQYYLSDIPFDQGAACAIATSVPIVRLRLLTRTLGI